LSFEGVWYGLKVPWVLRGTNLFIIERNSFGVQDSRALAAAANKREVPLLWNTEARGNDLIEIEAQQCIKNAIAKKTHHSSQKLVIIKNVRACFKGQSFQCLILVEHNLVYDFIHGYVREEAQAIQQCRSRVSSLECL